MLKCIFDKICELIGLLTEKCNQLEEAATQGDLICEKLDAILDPDVQCPECPILEHVFLWSGFDFDDGVFDAAYIHQSTVNGVALNNSFDAAWTSKSQAYQTTVDEVNDNTTSTMTLVSDVPINAQGKPQYRITVPAGDTLTIVNNHNDDTLSFSTAEDGSCVATFQDQNGDEIASFSPVEQ